ncbi:hypothetical protein ACIA6D_41150 [Streptomyces cacaoi]
MSSRLICSATWSASTRSSERLPAALGVEVAVAPPVCADTFRRSLRGTLDRLPHARDRFSFVLAAVHALSAHDQRHLLLDDLDHSRATLLVRRTGKPVHTVYLDELTYRPARQWLAARHRRWPATTSPYLLVTARTATDDTRRPVSIEAINKPLRVHGHQAGRLRVDRILNEAQHTDDPLHLIRLFGFSLPPHRHEPPPPRVREYLASHTIAVTVVMWPATLSLELPPQN